MDIELYTFQVLFGTYRVPSLQEYIAMHAYVRFVKSTG